MPTGPIEDSSPKFPDLQGFCSQFCVSSYHFSLFFWLSSCPRSLFPWLQQPFPRSKCATHNMQWIIFQIIIIIKQDCCLK